MPPGGAAPGLGWWSATLLLVLDHGGVAVSRPSLVAVLSCPVLSYPSFSFHLLLYIHSLLYVLCVCVVSVSQLQVTEPTDRPIHRLCLFTLSTFHTLTIIYWIFFFTTHTRANFCLRSFVSITGDPFSHRPPGSFIPYRTEQRIVLLTRAISQRSSLRLFRRSFLQTIISLQRIYSCFVKGKPSL